MTGALGSDGATAGAGAVDVHAHVTDPAGLAEMARLAPDLVPHLVERDGVWSASFPSGRTQTVEQGLIDLSTRLRDMDAQGVRYQALASWTALYLYDAPAPRAAELLAIQNDAIRRICLEHPDRFVAMGGLPLQDAALSVAEIERLAAFPEIAGVQICTNVNGANLDEERLEPVWEALEAAGIPVLVHPFGKGPAGKDRLTRYHLVNLIGNPLETAIAIASLAIGGVLERHPRLRWCFVHGGGSMPYQLGRWDHGWNVRTETKERIDRPPSESIARCYFDSLIHDAWSLRFLGQRFGWSQVVVGTDYPWDMGSSAPIAELEEAGLSGEVLEQVTSRNPLTFLRWPAKPA